MGNKLVKTSVPVLDAKVRKADKVKTKMVKMVERVNLMTGKKYYEAEDTPLCCSPASETFWSM